MRSAIDMGRKTMDTRDSFTEQDLEECISQCRYMEAYQRLLPLGSDGVVWAQAALGSLILCGLGVACNPGEAEIWLLRAAESGSAGACANLATLYTVHLYDDEKTRFYKRRSVELGCPFWAQWLEKDEGRFL